MKEMLKFNAQIFVHNLYLPRFILLITSPDRHPYVAGIVAPPAINRRQITSLTSKVRLHTEPIRKIKQLNLRAPYVTSHHYETEALPTYFQPARAHLIKLQESIGFYIPPSGLNLCRITQFTDDRDSLITSYQLSCSSQRWRTLSNLLC